MAVRALVVVALKAASRVASDAGLAELTRYAAESCEPEHHQAFAEAVSAKAWAAANDAISQASMRRRHAAMATFHASRAVLHREQWRVEPSFSGLALVADQSALAVEHALTGARLGAFQESLD
jgi:hypothetical protein